MKPAHEEDCALCRGTGKVLIPDEVTTVECYYFGCRGEKGHYWWRPNSSFHAWDLEQHLPVAIGARGPIDGGWCPGSIAGDHFRKTRDEVEGEAALHHVAGWTILAYWDRSVDRRGACNSNFVAKGLHDFVTMRAIARAQFPDVWNRRKTEPVLVIDTTARAPEAKL